MQKQFHSVDRFQKENKLYQFESLRMRKSLHFSASIGRPQLLMLWVIIIKVDGGGVVLLLLQKMMMMMMMMMMI